MNSIEKVVALAKRIRTLKPEDEETAQLLQLFVVFSPMLPKIIPDDPEVLDRHVAQIATWALECRSDDAPTLAIHEYDEEEEKWTSPA